MIMRNKHPSSREAEAIRFVSFRRFLGLITMKQCGNLNRIKLQRATLLSAMPARASVDWSGDQRLRQLLQIHSSTVGIGALQWRALGKRSVLYSSTWMVISNRKSYDIIPETTHTFFHNFFRWKNRITAAQRLRAAWCEARNRSTCDYEISLF